MRCVKLTDSEFYKAKDDFMLRFNNPKLIVSDENKYTIVARTESEAERNYPYCRFTKKKDDKGEFIITGANKKVYRSNWEFI